MREYRNPWAVRLLILLLRLRFYPFAKLWRALLGVDIGNSWPPGLILPHPFAVVIHAGTTFGPGCVVYQSVTIGEDGNGSRPPTIGANVRIFAGACVLGAITVGDGATIAANAVVVHDVPAGATVGGIPARIISESRK